MRKMNVPTPVFWILLLVTIAVIFTGCGKATPDPNYNYRVTGHFADWGSNYEEKFMMTNVAKSDARIKEIKSELKDAQYIYLYEYTPNKDAPAGWNVTYSGKGISLDGIYAIKFIRLEKDASEPSGWAYEAWMPSTEVSSFRGLSPDTIFVPMDRSNEMRDAAGDGLGSVNDNPVLLKGSVPYYVVLVIFKDGSRGIGAVVK